MDVDRRLEALEAENERLRDELEHLKASLGLRFLPPIEMRLTGMESRMFGRLLAGGVVTKDAFMAILYRNDGADEAEIKIVDVFLCKLRKKPRPFALPIQTIWGVGYMMEPATITKFKQEWGHHDETRA